MIGVMIVPTGLGCAIGGHAGDANPVAKLIANCCDTLITHPNVVNASDINEMTANTLYVEGSCLDQFLFGQVRLEPVKRYNKILVAVNKPLTGETVNAVNAARHTVGIDAEILELSEPLTMVARMEGGHATGDVFGVESLVRVLRLNTYDALAVHTQITVPRDVALNYYRNGGVNPWGGVEAKASKMIAQAIGKPVAHAPMESTTADDEELYFVYQERVGPRIAAEAVSICYLHCVLKGLHRAPRIRQSVGIQRNDVDFLLSPYGCWGPPHKACMSAKIPVIAVRENTVASPAPSLPYHTVVENYLEAAGLIMSMRAGVTPKSVRT